MPEHRVVVDTGFWLSYLIFRRGVIAKVGQRLARSDIQLVASAPCLGELQEVLQREKWDRYTSRDDRLLFYEGVRQRGELITTTSTITDCRDPKDNKFLELALDGKADFLITGDQDLLVLAETPNPAWRFRILTPRDFLDSQQVSS